jgi:hypothetical protein
LQAIETRDVDAELAASHQVIQGTGRTLLPEPYDNGKFPEVKVETLEETFGRMFADLSKYPLLGFMPCLLSGGLIFLYCLGTAPAHVAHSNALGSLSAR